MNELFIVIAIVFLSAGQVLQKIVANYLEVNYKKSIIVLCICAFLMGAGLCFWLLALRTIPLRQAYPFMSISILLVMFYSAALMKEKVTGRQWFGAFLIMAGLVLTSQ